MNVNLDYDALVRRIISFFIPGLGQFINGDIDKGLKILIGFIIIWLVLLFITWDSVRFILGIILRLFAAYDAYISYDPFRQ